VSNSNRRIEMAKLKVLFILLAIALLVVMVTPGAAAELPLDVNIVVDTHFLPTGNSGAFYASGPAVDAGLICSTGIATDIYNVGRGTESNRGATYLVLKQFVCNDGSGTFTMKLEARVDFRGDNAYWNISSGTELYKDLQGAGKDTGEFFDDYSGVTDYISGKVH
jgi:hypothetical protein